MREVSTKRKVLTAAVLLLFIVVYYYSTHSSPRDVLNVKDIGAKGDGVTDDTAILQAALNHKGRIYIPDGNYIVKATSSVVLRLSSDTEVIFGKNAKITLKPNDLDTCFIFQISAVEHVTLINPHIEGDRDGHLGTTGEWGHGINIEQSSNIKIIHPQIENCWGDGIYVGLAFGNKIKKQNNHISISNPMISRVRRNGISIASGKNINIVNPSITNIRNGISPMAGIDIEPEGTGTTKPVLENILIDNPLTKNCQYSILFAPEQLKNTGKNIDIKILHPMDIGSDYGFKVQSFTGAIHGLINIVHPVWIGNSNEATNTQDYSINGARVRITMG
jgi:hypothetical protein